MKCDNKKFNIRSIWCFIIVFWNLFMLFYLFCIGKFPIMSIFGSIPTLFFAFVSILILAFSIRLNMVFKLLALVGACMGFTQFEINFFTENKSVAQPGDTVVNIINWNTKMWDQYKDSNEFYSYLKDQKADIYILQEALFTKDDTYSYDVPDEYLKPAALTYIIPGFTPDFYFLDKTSEIKEYFPEYYISHQQQFVIISRYKIVSSEIDDSEQYQIADIEINGEIIRLFNVHFVLHLETFNPLDSNFYPALERRFVARSIAFENLHRDINLTGTDYIIAGDFNSPPTMGTMDYLIDRNRDLFDYSDDILPFSIEFLGMRIWRFDYVFTNKNAGFNVMSFKNLPVPSLSDHNAQIFQIIKD